MVDITGLNKGDVLAALYNGSRAQGMGFLQYNSTPMTREQAEELLTQSTYFDYLRGRVMKVRLDSDTEFDERWYDRDNGEGAAQRVITSLREEGVNNPITEELHVTGCLKALSELG